MLQTIFLHKKWLLVGFVLGLAIFLKPSSAAAQSGTLEMMYSPTQIPSSEFGSNECITYAWGDIYKPTPFAFIGTKGFGCGVAGTNPQPYVTAKTTTSSGRLTVTYYACRSSDANPCTPKAEEPYFVGLVESHVVQGPACATYWPILGPLQISQNYTPNSNQYVPRSFSLGAPVTDSTNPPPLGYISNPAGEPPSFQDRLADLLLERAQAGGYTPGITSAELQFGEIDWGDGSQIERIYTDDVEPGDQISHIWPAFGIYTIRYRAGDYCNNVSPWFEQRIPVHEWHLRVEAFRGELDKSSVTQMGVNPAENHARIFLTNGQSSRVIVSIVDEEGTVYPRGHRNRGSNPDQIYWQTCPQFTPDSCVEGIASDWPGLLWREVPDAFSEEIYYIPWHVDRLPLELGLNADTNSISFDGLDIHIMPIGAGISYEVQRPSISATPTSWQDLVIPAGDTATREQVFRFRNESQQPTNDNAFHLDWTALSNQGWLALAEPSNGIIGSLAENTLAAFINPAGLGEGTYTANIEVRTQQISWSTQDPWPNAPPDITGLGVIGKAFPDPLVIPVTLRIGATEPTCESNCPPPPPICTTQTQVTQATDSFDGYPPKTLASEGWQVALDAGSVSVVDNPQFSGTTNGKLLQWDYYQKELGIGTMSVQSTGTITRPMTGKADGTGEVSFDIRVAQNTKTKFSVIGSDGPFIELFVDNNGALAYYDQTLQATTEIIGGNTNMTDAMPKVTVSWSANGVAVAGPGSGWPARPTLPFSYPGRSHVATAIAWDGNQTSSTIQYPNPGGTYIYFTQLDNIGWSVETTTTNCPPPAGTGYNVKGDVFSGGNINGLSVHPSSVISANGQITIEGSQHTIPNYVQSRRNDWSQLTQQTRKNLDELLRSRARHWIGATRTGREVLPANGVMNLNSRTDNPFVDFPKNTYQPEGGVWVVDGDLEIQAPFIFRNVGTIIATGSIRLTGTGVIQVADGSLGLAALGNNGTISVGHDVTGLNATALFAPNGDLVFE